MRMIDAMGTDKVSPGDIVRMNGNSYVITDIREPTLFLERFEFRQFLSKRRFKKK